MVLNIICLFASIVTWMKTFQQTYSDENFSIDFSLKLIYEGGYSFSVSLGKASVSTFLFLLIVLSPSSKQYCSSDLSWRSSGTCRILGQLMMVAVPTGIFATFILSLVIFVANRSSHFPIKSRNVYFQIAYSLIFIFAVWIPLVVTNIFASNELECNAWISSKYGATFLSKGNVVGRHEMLELAKCLNQSSMEEMTDWKIYMSKLKHFLHNYDVTLHGTFGYFSHSGLCLPLFMASTMRFSQSSLCTNHSETTSTVLVSTFTVLCFMSIAISLSNLTYQRHVRSEFVRRLVYFCCVESTVWLPIAFMYFFEILCSKHAIEISDGVYQTVVLIVVVLSSSLLSPIFMLINLICGKMYSPVKKSDNENNNIDEIALNSSACD